MKNSTAKSDFIASFWRIYATKRIEKISIRELCQLAGYNRTTFYTHFTDIYDLLDQSIEAVLTPVKEVLFKFDNFHAALKTKEIIQIFLHFFKINSFYIETIIKNNHQHILKYKMKKNIASLFDDSFLGANSPDYLDYVVEYQVSAVFGMLVHWFKSGKTLSEQEFIKLLYETSSKGVFTMLDINEKD